VLHHDVAEQSELRRGRTSRKATWGKPASVLAGDFPYSRSLQLMVELPRTDVPRLAPETASRSPAEYAKQA